MNSTITKGIVWVIGALLYANTSFAQFSNATLNGQWFLHSIPMSIGLEGTVFYMGFDGNGNITNCCTFGTIGGSTYSVSASSGAISGTLITHSLSGNIDTARFSGQVISQNNATLNVDGTIMSLSRMLKPGALADSLVGVLTSPVAGQLNVIIRLDNQGQIISATGLVPPVSGRVHADSGVFVGHIKTGDHTVHSLDTLSSSWGEFTLVGTFAHDSLNGEISLDGPRDYDPYGTVHLVRMGVATGIGRVQTGDVPRSFSLHQNYPNPFNPSTTISFTLPEKLFVSLNVVDLLGREVATLAREEMSSGAHTRQWNAAAMPSGIYFYRLQAGSFVETRRLVLLK